MGYMRVYVAQIGYVVKKALENEVRTSELRVMPHLFLLWTKDLA